MPYFNNKIICDLVEEKHRGIIALLVKIWFSSGPTWRQAILSPTKLQRDWIIDDSPLIKDEECLRPGEATDLTLLEKMEEEIGGHPHFVTWVGNFCFALCPSDQTGTSHDHKHIKICTDLSLPADINLQTRRRGKHWKEETSASCTTLGRLHTVLLVRDDMHLCVRWCLLSKSAKI